MKTSDSNPVFRTAGDTGLIAEFGEGIDPVINARVRAVARGFASQMPQGVKEIIPTYRSLLFIYDPCMVSPDILMDLTRKMKDTEPDDITAGRMVEIPVCYGGEYGPDMDNVRSSSGLAEQEVIQIHSRPEYLIYMVGFTPGFCFLGGLDERLFTPRLKTPRMAVPQGSVGIANNQTGMYPIESPGGWQIIGRTPLRLFAPERENPFLYRAGDSIRFIPVSDAEYHRIKQEEQG
ncbi:MAG: 5-oxoprolinase subunit PxpB [Desulfobacteraceae bacterium]|nr:MAG: 5-oxoprolinase subunit PxpB [Desulfobacteraceae bacterium]